MASMLYTVNGRWGPVTYFSKDQYVGKSLRYYGEYNPSETEMIIALAQRDKLCLDIGANCGVMAQALEYSGFECVAFEPQPVVAEVCQKNMRGQVYNCGLGAEAGMAKMPKLRYEDDNNIGGMGIGYASIYGTIDVEVRTLDSFNFQNVGFMKIDVEGFEEQVLRGGRETILRDKPVMYIEDDRREKSQSLRKYIQELGYTISEHKPELYREHNFFGLKRNVWDRPYASHNLICRPLDA